MSYSIPSDLLYLPTHQWLKIEGDTGIVGITDYAQQALSGITWAELPAKGQEITSGMPLGSIESVKAVSDIVSPVSGEIIEVNSVLEDKPEIINKDPYGNGWIAKIRITEKADNLLAPDNYSKICED